MSAAPGRIAMGARAAAGATGPWSPARTSRALVAIAAAMLLVAWTTMAAGRAGELLAVPGVAGVVLVAVAVVRARARPLPAALVLLGFPAGVAALRAPVAVAAAAGAVIVVVLEFARWSVERRVPVPSSGSGERRRWLHVLLVVAGGWLAGVVVVDVASGRLANAAWQGALGAIAAIAVACAVVALARSRT